METHPDDKPVDAIREKAHDVARKESAPAPVQRYRAFLFQAVLILVTSGFSLLTFLVKMTPVAAVDVQITRAVQLFNFPGFGVLMELVSWPGFGPQLGFITVVIVMVIYALGLHWEAVAALAAAIFTTAVNLLVKDIIQRPRPTADLVSVFAPLSSYSFPSGHVMSYLGFFGFIGFLAFSLLKPSFKRGLILALTSGLIILVGVSRIYLGEHWASDVLGAYLLGTLTLLANIQFYRWGKTRFFVHQPVPTAAASHQP
jgi:membrane-associated phospholipid phosphatase